MICSDFHPKTWSDFVRTFVFPLGLALAFALCALAIVTETHSSCNLGLHRQPQTQGSDVASISTAHASEPEQRARQRRLGAELTEERGGSSLEPLPHLSV